MRVEDLQPKCKIKNKLWYELIVDKVIGNEIYTSHWNMPLTKFDRLCWTKAQIEKKIKDLSWILLDWKIRITKWDLQKLVNERIWNYLIEEFQVASDKDDSLIINKKLTKWDIVYIWNWVAIEHVWYTWNEMLWKFVHWKDELNIIILDDMLPNFSFNSKKQTTIKLVDVMMSLYGLSQDYLILLD